MNLIIDIGNTCTKLVCFDGSTMVECVKVTDGRADATAGFCKKHNFSMGICSSVAAEDPDIEKVLDRIPFEVIRFRSGITPVPVTICYKSPLTLGSDRIAAVVNAAHRSPGKNVLVIDIGTCITYDFLNASGQYIGGNISPGIEMRLKALEHFTGRLPLVNAEGALPDMGYDTETAIRCGVISAVNHEVRGYIEKFLNRYPDLTVYLTGGGRHSLHDIQRYNAITDDQMVTEGLNIILQYNKDIRTKDIK